MDSQRASETSGAGSGLSGSGLAGHSHLRVPLAIHSPLGIGAGPQPVTVGIPFGRGLVREPAHFALASKPGTVLPVQTAVTARWPDQSIQWLLADWLVDASVGQGPECLVALCPVEKPPEVQGPVTLRVEAAQAHVETSAAAFDVRADGSCLLSVRRLGSRVLAYRWAVRVRLADQRGRAHWPEFHTVRQEASGPIRTTLALEGRFPRYRGLVCQVRMDFYAGTGLVRLCLTVRNPHRARHRGGLWDLGDPGSVLLGALNVEAALEGQETPKVLWRAEPAQPMTLAPEGTVRIYQASSGGENWLSPNHVNRQGRVPVRIAGYRVETPAGCHAGRRACPLIAIHGSEGSVVAAMPDFWQTFPKAMGWEHGLLRLGVFPEQWEDGFELQGGEQKTHTVWLSFQLRESPDAHDSGAGLAWVYEPVRVVATPAWYAQSGVIAQFLPAEHDPDHRLRTLLDSAVRGPQSLVARREIIDEYGWRHFGDLYADHENAYYEGPKPVISHYNNQFDVLYGAIVQMMRTGDVAWADVLEPLARHVIDIDVYHTTEDRPAYNQGLFWLTDHYRSAHTATHRTYSRYNRLSSGDYGGGPGNEHNYTTGLLHYFYLTGDPQARDTVLGLADWVIAMDDGSQTVWGVLDSGPTGLASQTDSAEYHGPGRGAGNSINALLDGWLASGRRAYLEKAEALIRRTIHPRDDVDGRALLRVEARWSYTIYLAVLSRYLDLKAQHGELDFMYAYAQASLVHYAQWMLAHERPYFDHPEELEYPTEAWAAQEFRKANALRHAARHAPEALRDRLLRRGGELGDRAWSDLMRFESWGTVRAVAVMLLEGMRDAYWRRHVDAPAPRPPGPYDFGQPELFVPQAARVRRRLRSPRGLLSALVALANPRNWGRIATAIWRWRN